MHEASDKKKLLTVIGDEDIVIGFGALGFKTYAAKDAADMTKILEEVVREEASICLVQDELYVAAQGTIANYSALPVPVFIPFSKDGRMERIDQITKEIRLRATGKL